VGGAILSGVDVDQALSLIDRCVSVSMFEADGMVLGVKDEHAG
jgi:hypothetical protein